MGVALRLLSRDEEGRYTNSKVASKELVKQSRHYWGDYLRMQVDKQFYTNMQNLQDIMMSGTSKTEYQQWFDEHPEAASMYTKAQHNGSLATAGALLRRVDLSQARSFLDVGGGSGAFSIMVARRNPRVHCVVLDLPNVITQCKQILIHEEASIAARISTKALSATHEWAVDAESFDVVNMSYICGSVPKEALPSLFERAFAALRPGGRILIHDFMVQDRTQEEQQASLNGALWALAHVSVNPQGVGLRPQFLSICLRTQASWTQATRA